MSTEGGIIKEEDILELMKENGKCVINYYFYSQYMMAPIVHNLFYLYNCIYVQAGDNVQSSSPDDDQPPSPDDKDQLLFSDDEDQLLSPGDDQSPSHQDEELHSPG